MLQILRHKGFHHNGVHSEQTAAPYIRHELIANTRSLQALDTKLSTSNEIRKRQGFERTSDDWQADFPGAIVRAAVPIVRQDAWRNTGPFHIAEPLFHILGNLMGVARKKRVVHVEKDGPHPFFTQIIDGVYRRNATEITIGSEQDNPNPYRCSAIAA